MMREIFCPEREEVTGWDKMYKSNNLYLPSNIIMVMKLKKMVWAQHVARMRTYGLQIFWSKNLMERDHLKYMGE